MPGYQAPEDTIAARVRDVAVFGRILAQAYEAGALAPPDLAPPAPAALSADAANLREIMPGVPDDLIFRGLTTWTGLYGWVNFEVFGQFENTIQDRRGSFEQSARTLGALLGLKPE